MTSSNTVSFALAFVVVVLASAVGAPIVAADDVEADTPVQEADEVAYDELSDELEALASDRPDEEPDLSDDARAAAEEGAQVGVSLAQEEGVDVSQAQVDAAVDGAVRAAAQNQDASVTQIQAAARGASRGALLQSQRANATQIQAGVYGSAAGSLSQSQSADVTQIQSAAYGAAHGTIAQHQRVNVTQIQFAAVGSAAGAAHGAVLSQQATVTQIQEAAQGSAYGSLVQTQRAELTQIQAAAFGGAGGGTADATDADPKKVQEAAMGASEGALVQRQRASVSQVQAAARGACKGTLTQVQRATVTQIQKVSKGAAEGAISQSQSATVTQIQAAATGAARGTVTQVQVVDVVQVQRVATGAASGAAKSAAQNQVVNVEQIQAAAAGAGEGTVVQIQQVNIVQIQIIAESAASGALSQHQVANVVQIQSAARGAGEGAVSLQQRQTVTIRQIQILTERAAADTAGAAAALGIDDEATIYDYARGATVDDEPDEDDLRSLFASVADGTVFLANPNDVAVTVTVTDDDGEELQTVTLAPGESTTTTLERGTYTLTAETNDGRDVELAGRDVLTVTVGDELRSLTATVEDGTLTVENPNDERVTVTLRGDDFPTETFDIPRNWEVTWQLEPGTYTLTAETEDGTTVPVNGEDEAEVTVEDDLGPPEAVDLSVAVDNGDVTIENPSDADVTVTATSETGEEREIAVAAGATETATFELGTYTLTGVAEDERPVTFDGEEQLEITVEDEEPVDLTATVEERNVSIENPSDVDVTVTVSGENVEDQAIDVESGETVTQELEPGTYTLTGQAADERPVTFDGEEQVDITIPDEEPVDLNVTVEDGSVTVENPSDVDVTVTATSDAGEEVTMDVAAGETEMTTLDPGAYTVTGTTEADREVLFDGQEQLEITIEDGEPVDLTVTVEGSTVTVENPSDTAVTVTATDETGEERPIDVPGGETVTEELEPGTYTFTAASEDDRPVTFDSEERLEITIEGTPVEIDRTIDSCTVIDEPGEYELAEDIEGGAENVCLTISVSDVVLEGNDHTIAGAGAEDTIGVQVYDPEFDPREDELANVTVRNLNVENWDLGAEVGNFSDDHRVQATLENVDATDNERGGVLLVNAGGSGFEAVTANRNGGGGITLWETSDVTFESITVSENDGHGLYLWDIVHDSEFTDVTATANGNAGIGTGQDILRNTIANSHVADNDGPGISIVDSGDNTIQDTTVENNGDAGIFVEFSRGDDLQRVTVRGNDGWQIDAREQASLTATELAIGDAAEFTFAEESVALDAVEPDALPALPETATAVGGGVDVIGIEGSVEAIVEYDETAVEGDQVELWRHDGEEWATAGAFDADGTIETELTEDGVYAPVEAQAEEEVDPEEAVEFVDCRIVEVKGEFDEVEFETRRYASDGLETQSRTLGPVDGTTRFPDDLDEDPAEGINGYYVHSVTLIDEDRDVSATVTNPDAETCLDEIRPALPTVEFVGAEAAGDDEIAVTFGYDNPNDDSIQPAMTFTEGTTADSPPAALEPGAGEFTATWTPETGDERLILEVDASGFGYEGDEGLLVVETPPAGEFLEEAPEETPAPPPEEEETPPPEEEETPEPPEETPDPTPEETPPSDGDTDGDATA